MSGQPSSQNNQQSKPQLQSTQQLSKRSSKHNIQKYKRKRGGTRGKSINKKKHKRQVSRAHHATVHSLARVNAPMLRSLGQTSLDLKITHELRKALIELRRKEEDYLTAMEIGESLAKDNNQLHQQLQSYENQCQMHIRENRYLREKLETVEHCYHSDLRQYEINQENDKRMILRLEEIISQKTVLIQQLQMQAQSSHLNHSESNHSQENSNGNTPKYSANIGRLERETKKLKLKLVEKQKTIDDFMERFNRMTKISTKFEKLKYEFGEYQQGAEHQMQEQIAIQTAMQNEVIFLSSRNANLEEEKGELVDLIEQRDYEITMLGQQLKLNERKNTSLNSNVSITNNYGVTTPIDPGNNLMIDLPEILDEELVMIEEYINNEEIFTDDDYYVHDDADEEYYEDEGHNTQQMQSPKDSESVENETPEPEKSPVEVYDKIREFLHLTASAVKIKYPTVMSIKSHDLISTVSNLPFHKFHDAMSRVMESELKKNRLKADAANNKLSIHTRTRSNGSTSSQGGSRKGAKNKSGRKKSSSKNKRAQTVKESKRVSDSPISKRTSFFSLFFRKEEEAQSAIG